MDRAPLRPVPTRPAGPIDPAAAIGEVAAALPSLTALEARAFALVALADRPRPQVAEVLGIEEQELGTVLAAARKELRRALVLLPGSGWCERAEALISDRLDGPVAECGARRLDVHLRNCPRCVEHERRLVQATDALLAGVAPLPPPPAAVLTATELVPVGDAGVRDPARAEDEDVGEDGALAGDAADVPAPAVAAPPPEPDAAAPPAEPDAAAPPPRRRSAASAAAADQGVAGPPARAQVAAAAEVLVAARTRGQLAAAVTWNALAAIALVLTVASIALIVAGILGARV